MPNRHAGGDNLLEDALAALVLGLTEAKAPWMVIGGIAMIARGVRRFTSDVDVVVRGDAISIRRLAAALAIHEIKPRIQGAIAFAEANLVLLMRHAPTGVDMDISLGWSSLEQDAIASCSVERFGRIEAPMSSPKDLLVLKAIAGRPKDLEDIEALLVLYPQIDLERVRERIAALAELAGAPDLVFSFDAVAERARGGKHPSIAEMKRKNGDGDSRPANETFAKKRAANETPANRIPTNAAPVNKKLANKSRESKKPANKSRDPSSPVGSGVRKKPANKARASTRPANKARASTRPANKSRASTKPESKSRESKKPANKTRASTRPANKSRASTKPESKSRESKRPANKTRASTKPASKKPTNRKPANRDSQNKAGANEKSGTS